MKLASVLIVFLLVLGTLVLPCAAAAVPDSPQLIRISGVVWWISSLETYGILSADGKKYHPIKRLPREFQKDRLEVVVEGKIREDLMGSSSTMWGTPLEVVKITKASEYIWPEERQALPLLLERMSAFNDKDLGKLQKIDDIAKGLTPEQFSTWLGDNGKFTLHYIETVPDFSSPNPASTITGFCLYSRQRLNSFALSGNVNYSLMSFTLTKAADGWRFTATGGYKPEDVADMDKYISDLLDKSKKKFGTTNLAEWKR